MKRPAIMLPIFLLAAAIAAGGSGVSRAAERLEDEMSAGVPRERFDPRRILDLVYSNRPDSALALLDSARRANPTDPYVLVLEAKVLRDRLNDEDNDKDLIRRSADPIHAVLDTAITLADAALRRDGRDWANYYYRGYAWLSKAQLYVLTRSYWSAGRAAGRGKDDLERYLKKYPEDPDATGTLGAYLYFADAIPGFVKILAKIFFMPGGDRERGLELLEYATTHDGVLSADWRFVLAAVDLVFEGNFEKGAAEFVSLLEKYPYYTRLAEPIAVVAPLYPGRTREFRDLAERAAEAHVSMTGAVIDWSLVKRMRLVDAFTDTFFGHPAEAVREYDALIKDPPRSPDWVLPIAILNRGYIAQKRGDEVEAKKAYEEVRSNARMSTYRRAAEGMLESIGKAIDGPPLAELDFVGKIYEGDLAEGSRLLDAWKSSHKEDVLTDFYTGDLEALRGDLGAAEKAYRRALDRDAYGGDEFFQTLSSARLAEILGGKGRYDEARDRLKRAREYCHANYLLDFLLEARERYYGLLESGKLESKPSLLSRAAPFGTPGGE